MSFREYAHFSDRAQAARWRDSSPRSSFTAAELQTYRSARFYPTGAAVFEELTRQGLRWADLPDDICRKFEHLGHMSWAAEAQKQAYVSQPLAELV